MSQKKFITHASKRHSSGGVGPAGPDIQQSIPTAIAQIDPTYIDQPPVDPEDDEDDEEGWQDDPSDNGTEEGRLSEEFGWIKPDGQKLSGEYRYRKYSHHTEMAQDDPRMRDIYDDEDENNYHQSVYQRAIQKGYIQYRHDHNEGNKIAFSLNHPSSIERALHHVDQHADMMREFGRVRVYTHDRNRGGKAREWNWESFDSPEHAKEHIKGLSYKPLDEGEEYRSHGWILPSGKVIYGQHTYDHHDNIAKREMDSDFYRALSGGCVRFRHDRSFGSMLQFSGKQAAKNAVDHLERNSDVVNDLEHVHVSTMGTGRSFKKASSAINHIKRRYPSAFVEQLLQGKSFTQVLFETKAATTLSHYDDLLHQVSHHIGSKVYLVGGAVRDAVLNKPSKDTDLTVVAKPEHLESLGYTRIKKDFPVYQHPKFPGVEVALARGEKKTGAGHSGFSWHLADSIHDDLGRRDLTMNAMAYHPDHGVIDPHGGMHDLHSKTIKHVSAAFSEDPLRTFRVARFAAKFGYHVHPSTVEMMRSTNHELPTLSHERVRDEFSKAMKTPHPRMFFDTLKRSGSLQHWYPELHAQIGQHSTVPSHHDAYEHTMHALEHSVKHGHSEDSRDMLLTQQSGVAGVKTYGERFGLKRTHINNMVSHAEHHLTPFKAPLPPEQAVEYWRRTKNAQKAHQEASEANSAAAHGPNQIDRYKRLFSTLGSTRIDPKMKVLDIHKHYTKVASTVENISEAVHELPSLSGLPKNVHQKAVELYNKVKGNPNKVGDSASVDGYWIETHTLGCVAHYSADDNEKWENHWKMYDKLKSEKSIIAGDAEDGHFVAITKNAVHEGYNEEEEQDFGWIHPNGAYIKATPRDCTHADIISSGRLGFHGRTQADEHAEALTRGFVQYRHDYEDKVAVNVEHPEAVKNALNHIEKNPHKFKSDRTIDFYTYHPEGMKETHPTNRWKWHQTKDVDELKNKLKQYVK